MFSFWEVFGLSTDNYQPKITENHQQFSVLIKTLFSISQCQRQVFFAPSFLQEESNKAVPWDPSNLSISVTQHSPFSQKYFCCLQRDAECCSGQESELCVDGNNILNMGLAGLVLLSTLRFSSGRKGEPQLGVVLADKTMAAEIWWEDQGRPQDFLRL